MLGTKHSINIYTIAVGNLKNVFSPYIFVPMEVEQVGAHDVELRVELAVHPHDVVEEHRVEVF